MDLRSFLDDAAQIRHLSLRQDLTRLLCLKIGTDETQRHEGHCLMGETSQVVRLKLADVYVR